MLLTINGSDIESQPIEWSQQLTSLLRRGGRMSKRISLSISCTLTFLLLCAASVSAQRTTGDISGTVMDQSGAAVGGAAITAVNSAIGLTRTATSSSSGAYT